MLRATPGLAVERSGLRGQTRPEGLVLDREEPTLAYGPAYLGLMRAAPLLAVLCLASSFGLAGRSRRPGRA